MKLAPASKVLSTMGIVENQGSLASAGHVLGLSTSVIENLLETSLSPEMRSDYFQASEAEPTLRLTNMLVEYSSVIVCRSIDGAPPSSPGVGEIVPASEYTVDMARGLVCFPSAPTADLSVYYSSGLKISDADRDLLLAPVWLQDIAVAVTIYGMNMLQTSVTNRKDRNVGDIATELRNMSYMLLSSRRRPRMTVSFPSASVLHG